MDSSNELVQEQDHAASSLDASFVLTWEEIASLAAEPGKPAETLMNVVALIARRFGTDVCSAYLLEPDRANLVLAATLGLRRECIGKLRMAVNEGLAGLVAEQVRPVAVEQTTPIEATDVNEVDGCTWIERGVGYALMAAEPYDKLEELARVARQGLRSPG